MVSYDVVRCLKILKAVASRPYEALVTLILEDRLVRVISAHNINVFK